MSDGSGLAERQARLVAALVGGAEPPPGFDPALLAATTAGLLGKRAGDVARAWPELAASLGPDWGRWFAGWAAGRPPGGSHADGLAAARHRRAAGDLTGAAAVELAVREAAGLPWWSARWDRAARVLRIAGRTFVFRAR
ncbi:hypothetical protein R8Z50_25355 [Longispora sp. K20-0274]|uniref:hypothetical protein n=1 Tax=Longispora sp. K20-0274 TaxID=3088255 RepID=UPI00399A864F